MLLPSKSSLTERNSKQGTERQKTVSGIFHLLLDFELYMKKQFKKKPQESKKTTLTVLPFTVPTTVKSTCTVPKAVVGLSCGTVDLIFLLRRVLLFDNTPYGTAKHFKEKCDSAGVEHN